MKKIKYLVPIILLSSVISCSALGSLGSSLIAGASSSGTSSNNDKKTEVEQKEDALSQTIMEYTKGIATNPNEPKLYYLRGKAYKAKAIYEVGSTDLTDLAYSAIADFDMAIKLDPKYKEAYLERALTYCVVLKDSVKANADFQKSCDKGVDCSDICPNK